MAKKEVFCLVRKKKILIDARIADALVKMRRAEYTVKPAANYQTKVMVAQDPKEELKKTLDKAGIEYDGRWGESKLKELVETIGKDA